MPQTILTFINTRKARWERLELLVKALERGETRKLSSSDLRDINRLYREATADLARLQAFRQEDSVPEELETYVNDLVGRAYGQIYRNPPPGWSSLWTFFRFTFPRTFRETLPWTLLALSIFGLGFAYGFGASLTDEAFIPLVVPPHLIQKVEEGQVWFDSIVAIKPLASSMIMTNNITVTFLAFAFGITFGLGTLYLMAFNGLLAGTLAGLCHTHGLSIAFWSFVLPHGVIELTAIFVAGAAGFLLASALIIPGDLPRKDALIQKAMQAGRLTVGCIPLLIVAGVIEGFFSPAPLAPSLKFLAAGGLFVLLLSYLLLPGTTKALSVSPPGSVPESRPKASTEAGPKPGSLSAKDSLEPYFAAEGSP
jgi:uncharacterized membrane protein SpoIIM required for sporulation